MSHSLSQRYDVSLETRLCKNMVFYEYFMAKIKSLPWATDTDAQEWLCYMKELHRALRFLQVSMTNTFSVSLALHVCIIYSVVCTSRQITLSNLHRPRIINNTQMQ